MATFNVRIKVLEVGPIEQKTEKFSVMRFHGKEMDMERENLLELQAINKMAEDLENYLKPGVIGTFKCEVQGRKHKERVFQNLTVIGFDIDEASSPLKEEEVVLDERDGDLPF